MTEHYWPEAAIIDSYDTSIPDYRTYGTISDAPYYSVKCKLANHFKFRK